MEKYKFFKYNQKYKILFQREKNKLRELLPKGTEIEHIGSTSIKGLGGKGIIDILIGAKKTNLQKVKKILTNNNYYLNPTGGSKGRIYFEKDYKYNKKTRRVHIHLVDIKTNYWKNPLKFKEAMKKNPKLIKEYKRIKKEAVKISKGKGKIYRKHKHKFLKKVTEKY